MAPLCGQHASMAKKRIWCFGLIALIFLVSVLTFRLTPSDDYVRFWSSLETYQKLNSSGLGSSPTVVELKLQTDAVHHTDDAFALYVLMDRNEEDQWKWLINSISSNCKYIHRFYVRVLLEKTESKNLKLDRNFNASLARCSLFGSTVQFRIIEVKQLRTNTRTLTQLMADDYVFTNIEYFQVIRATQTKNSELQDWRRLLVERSTDRVGIVSSSCDDSKDTCAVFFSKIHFEIFGWFIPPFIADVTLAVTYAVAVYPTNISLVVRNELHDADGLDAPSADLSKFSATEVDLLKMDKETLQRYLSVARSSSCFRCFNNSSQKVISMSLYGSDHRYTMGALRNAQLFPVTFPGWRLRFYVEKQTIDRPPKYGIVPPAILSKVQELGAEIRYIDVTSTGLAPMLWRFSVVEDVTVDVFIVRDCDSRLTPRDAIVVSDWLKTDKIFHCIRDHPSHSRYSVSGGLWGAKRKPFMDVFGQEKLSNVMRKYGSGYIQDMNFLGSVVWPQIKTFAYCHDSFSCKKYPSSHPFPVARIGAEHLGQVYDEFSLGRKNDMDTIRRTPVNRDCVSIDKNNNNRL